MILDELHIRDLALIEEAWIELGPGMTVLTGETGAGKTVLLGALKLLLGERADATSVRSGATEALVEGRILTSEGELLVRRRVSADGRSRCTLDGELATVGALAARVGPIVDLHGQHEHQSLLSPSTHVGHLDAWARETVPPTLAAYRAARTAWRVSVAEREDLRRRLDVATVDADRLRRLVAEVAAVDPRPGEDDEIEARMPTLQHAERLSEAASVAATLLRGEGGALDLIAQAGAALGRVAGIDPELDALAAQVVQAEALVDDSGSSARAYRDGVEHDPAALDAAQSRLSALAALKRSYGPALDDVLAAAKDAAAALGSVDDSESALAAAHARVGETQLALEVAARALGDARRVAGPQFAEAVGAVTSELAMEGARLEVAFSELTFDSWTDDGPDRVEFLFSPAPGQPVRPLARIASGGEISRVMLALKGVTSGSDAACVLVFDEVDAGIGGATATAVGARLASLATTRQVIVVTHLAQVAVFADTHLVVQKTIDGGTAMTTVVPVEGESRLSELARMLSGDDSETSRAHAAELLDRAQRR